MARLEDITIGLDAKSLALLHLYARFETARARLSRLDRGAQPRFIWFETGGGMQETAEYLIEELQQITDQIGRLAE